MRHIEVFRAVMLARSMTGAANMLYVTQSAVSKIIRELEDQLGFVLFTRRKGGLIPSPEAISLFAEVERVFLGLDKIVRTGERIRSKRQGQLRIVTMPALSTFFLQGVVRAFHKECPDVSISLETYNSREIADLVASGQFDLGYAMTPIDDAQNVVCRVMRINCVCVLPAGHRLSAKEVIDVSDFAGEHFISLASGNTTRLKIDAMFKNENVAREMLIEAAWSAAVIGLVANELGLSIIDPFTAQVATIVGCVVRPLGQQVEFSFAELRPRQGTENTIAELFSKHFTEQYQALV